MLSPYLGFGPKDIVGIYTVAAATAAGLALGMNAADATPITPTPYGNTFGTLVPVSCTTTNKLRETGWLLQPVTTTGPSVFNLLSSIYDESVVINAVPAVVLSKAGAQVATDQYVASGGAGAGQILFDGSVAVDTPCSIAAGQPRTILAGDAQRLLFKGQVSQRNTACAVFEIQ